MSHHRAMPVYLAALIVTAAIAAAAPPSLRAADPAASGTPGTPGTPGRPGFRPIFDGRTLTGWSAPDMSYWSVEDGAITARSTEQNPATANQFLVWDQGELDDFELKLRFRITGTDAANSGVQIRSAVLPDGHAVGYQADIDRAGQWVGALYDEHGRALLANRGQRVEIDAAGAKRATPIGDADELFAHVHRDDWNEYHIIARGPHITLRINGHTMAEVIDNQPSERDLSGVLALQLHSGPPMTVQFRDIALKRLPLSDGRKKAVFVAGGPSHGYGAHEHRAGTLLLAGALNENLADRILATVYTGGWPDDPTAFDNADGVVLYCDGGGGHMVIPHLERFGEVMDRGVGLACIHYAVEVPKGRAGDAFLGWIGGYFETHWSVNPHWRASFEALPDHPITRGVRPFEVRDEWYYHMRFGEGMEGVTPILTDLPPSSTLRRDDGPHSNNPHVRDAVLERKAPQHVAWAYERPDGGRGFGFTGGHFHWNWGHDQFRKLVLNAVVWVSGAEVPSDGVASGPLTAADLEANQDYEQPDRWNSEAIQETLDRWNPRKPDPDPAPGSPDP